MNEIVTVNNNGLAIKEYQGQRVITFSDIDSVHNIHKGISKRNFTNNKKRFVINEDYYFVSKNELGAEFTLSYGFGKNAATGILLTESGYLMITKPLTDEKS